jgi:hypothetical protein
MAQSCFRPIQLHHNYSPYDRSLCRCGLVTNILESPLTNPILALVEAMWTVFTFDGITQDDLFAEVEVLFPGIYTVEQLQTALAKAMSTGVFICLVPPIRYQCCETEPPTARFTFSPNLDRSPGNKTYVAYLYGQVTATPAVKKALFFQIFKAYCCAGTGQLCSSC